MKQKLVILRLLMFLAVAGSPSLARADEVNEKAEAKKHYNVGLKAYNIQEWKTALDELKAAYVSLPDPVLLFDIAQCQRNLGMYDAAIKSYQVYLHQAPDSANVDEVRARILDMQKAAQARNAPPIGTQPPLNQGEVKTVTVQPAPMPQPRRWYKSPSAWTLSAAGVGTLIIGGLLFWHSNDLRNQSFNSLQEQSDLSTSANNYEVSGLTLIGIGSASVVAGGVVFAVEARRSHSSTEVAHVP